MGFEVTTCIYCALGLDGPPAVLEGAASQRVMDDGLDALR